VNFRSGKSRWPVAMMAALLALLLWFPAHAAAPAIANPKVQGDYDVLCRGVINGKIKATVSARHVHFNGTVRNEAGADVTINGKVDLVNGRFNGTVNAGGQELELTGRIDPPVDEANGNHARLVCNVKAQGDKFGRMAGARVK
jgi:hypothetical protein